MRLAVYIKNVINALGENVGELFSLEMRVNILSLKASQMLREFFSPSDISLKRFAYVAFYISQEEAGEKELRQINYSANRLMTPNRASCL